MSINVHKAYTLGDFLLEPDNHLLTRQGLPVPLTKKRFEVLVYLIEHRDRLVRRQELLDQFWDGSEVYEENLTKCISEIRKALADQKKPHRFIQTFPAIGYRFIGPLEEDAQPYESFLEVEKTRGLKIIVEEDDGDDAVLVGETVLPAQLPPATTAVTLRPRASRQRRLLVPLILVCAVIALAATAFVVYRSRTSGVIATPPQPVVINSIAVLPFRNLSGSDADDYFSDGMTESMITTLSQVDGMKVISRSGVFRFKGREADPIEVGKQLGVAAVLEGSVRKDGDTVHVALRLVSVDDGRVLWADESHDRKVQDLFALQDEIARNVAAGLKVKLSGAAEQRLRQRQTDNTEAYQLYLKGRFYLNKFTVGDLKKSIDYFNQAVAIDPRYAEAYAGLADSYIALGVDFIPPKEAFPKAKIYALKALELDETLGKAHYSLGAINYLYEWNWPAAQKELQRTLQLNPEAVETTACYLHSLDSTGKPDEAIAQVRRALELNPLSILIHGELGCASYYARQYDQTIGVSRQTLEMDPSFDFARYNIARAYGQKGMYREAIAELSQIGSPSARPPMIIAELGYDYARLGQSLEARKMLDELKERAARGDYVDPYPVSFIYVGLGENDQALEWLQKSYDLRSSWIPWLKVEPKFDSLRADPRFTSLLNRVGTPQ